MKMVGVVVVILALAGCASTNAFPVFDEEPTEADVLPSYLSADEFPYDMSSVRFVGSRNETDFYLLKTEPDGGVCLALAAGPTNSMVACGGNGGIGTGASTQTTTACIVAAGTELEPGWAAVSDNVWVRDPSLGKKDQDSVCP